MDKRTLNLTFSLPVSFFRASAVLLLWTGTAGVFAQTPANTAGTASASIASLDAPASLQRAFLKKNCFACHNEKLRTAGLSLENLDLQDVARSGEILEKVVHKVWSGAMPPASVPRPDKTSVSLFLASLEITLDQSSAAHPNPGRPTTLHRLNRTEYVNAVRDIFGVELNPREVATLPADDESYGFDNNGDVLGLSPLLLERYLSVARKVTNGALGVPAGAEADAYTHHADYSVSQAQWVEGLPLGTRGGTAFTYRFPADGEYLIKMKLQRFYDRLLGFGQGGSGTGAMPRQWIEVAIEDTPVAMFSVGLDQTLREPLIIPEESAMDHPIKALSKVELAERGFTGDDGLEFRVFVKAGAKKVRADFLARFAPMTTQMREPYASGTGGPPRPMGIDSIMVTGPFNAQGPGDTPSRRRILTCQPKAPAEEMPCARTVLTKLATRAYRRPVTQNELQELLTAYEVGRKNQDFETGFNMALRRMLMDPAFLFRAEHEPVRVAANTPFRISDLELASRLSFFLWSSAPDDELLAAAEKGQLKDPAVLEAQTRRMLADRRAENLVSNFGEQWLSLRQLSGIQPDPVIFSDFDDGLRRAFLRETEMLLEHVMLGDRNVLELLNANYTFVNERLAQHYGIPGVYGDQFRRVTTTDGIRGGLLGQGSILTATSYPNRTSPVLRGKWILETLLGSPPPPPPPDVPALPDAEGGKVLSMRERMAEHRKNPACAGCHARMDPLGFALENFDATGKWRSGETSGPADLILRPIDASAQLADGTKFDGIAGLKAMLQNRSEEFVYTLTERLMTFALGRGTDWYDAPAIRAAVRAAKTDDYRFSALVLGVVKSAPFQMRMPSGAEHAQQVRPQAAKNVAN